jgi:adhesin transport system membrane fusion protein
MSPKVPAYPARHTDALALAGGKHVGRRFARLILLFLLAAPCALVFAPWQQNLPGEGRVIEYDPIDRPLPIQARTDGVLLKWHVREGQDVKAGDPIVDLADNDPRILERLQDQLTAAQEKRAASAQKRAQYEGRAAQAELARASAMLVADDQIRAAEQAVEVAKQGLAAAEENVKLNGFLESMFEGLVKERIAPGFELQRAKQQSGVARAELRARQAGVAAAEANLQAAKSNRARVENDEQAKVQSALADRDAASGDVADADGAVLRLQRDLERQRQQSVLAPADGFVQRLFANGQGGGFVKQGATLALLVPRTKQRAVELLVDGNDVTFLDVGRHVRLLFEGWPAVQWVGWPSVAVGTFGGRVAFIDRFDDGKGHFRVMVLPDERPFAGPEGPVVNWLRELVTFEKVSAASNPHAWPDERWLRQGTRAKGWIVLDRVSLGFEIWRQLNGFPPSIEPPGKAPSRAGATPEDGK